MEDLRGTATPELETNSTPKIMGAAIVALGVGVLGAYTLSAGIWNSSAPPRVIASAQPQPVKIAKPVAPVAPIAPEPQIAPASPYQHAADTTAAKPASTAAKPATRIAHARRSDTATSVAPDNSISAPSVPADAATPANASTTQAEPLSATGGQQAATPAPSDGQP